MRIVAGRHRGLRLHGPADRGPTRPTTDRARETLFSVMGDRVNGCRFLDLFGGTGAIAIEAYSRGADEVVTVECHPRALSVIRKNLTLVKEPGEIQLVRRRVEAYLARCQSPFDLIFADPPFRVSPDKVLGLLAGSRAVGLETGVFLEYRRDQSSAYPDPPPPPPGWSLGRSYRAGEQEITAYQKDEE